VPDFLNFYHHLPPPLRSWAATFRGVYLRAWRYGLDHEHLVSEALERDTWSAERWKSWREERLAYVLDRAATQVPYYRKQWAERRRKGEKASWEVWENWPVLEKEPLRSNPKAFVADDCDVDRMFHEHTSGTTGKSLDLWWSKETVREWYAIWEARCRRWYGVSRHDRWAILGGQLVTPVEQRQPPFWVWNHALNQLYMSSFHLAPDLIPAYLDALVSHNIRYIWGYTSSLYALAQKALRLARSDLQMAIAITNAEPVYDYQRETIEQSFQCPVRETYGSAEITTAASDCEHGNLHLWPEVGLTEVFRNGHRKPLGETGELVCTGLLNADMPLIRYRVGDTGALASPDKTCPCGRSLPLLSGVEGRVDDVLYTTDGRYISRLDPVFKAHLPVREAQIIQEELDRVRVRYVPAPDYTPEAGVSIIERLQARMGSIEVVLEEVAEVPREPNGKFRAVISKVPEEQIAELLDQDV